MASTLLCDEGRGGGALIPPGWGEGTNSLVVAGEAVDTGFDKNQTAATVSDNVYYVDTDTYNFESLSLRLPDKCLRTATAFLISICYG